ncbi:hypothetical protein [Marinithermofilum abyssi]|nr:hypothetical protein [Marinithermofilum abyssi]
MEDRRAAAAVGNRKGIQKARVESESLPGTFQSKKLLYIEALEVIRS